MNLLDPPGSGTLDSHQIAPSWKLRLVFNSFKVISGIIHQFGNIEKVCILIDVRNATHGFGRSGLRFG
jgi:hypothetical protein